MKNTKFSFWNYPYFLTVMKTENPTFIFISYIFLSELSGVCTYAKNVRARSQILLLFFTPLAVMEAVVIALN
jgi:hypothetical protein